MNKLALHAKKCPNWAFYGVLGEFSTGCGVGGGVLGESFRGTAAGRAAVGELFRGSAVGEPLKALTVSVRMRVRSPCGRLSSPGDKFRMQFPSRYFKS